MEKRIFVVTCVCMTLFIAISLSGCGNGESYSKKYDTLKSDYTDLSNKYSALQEQYNQLNVEYKKLQNLPDISVTLVDDRDDVNDLSLHSSLEAAEKNYKKVYYNSGRRTFAPYNFIVTCNNGQTVDDIYYIDSRGKMISIMKEKVNNLGNTFTFTDIPDFLDINSIIIECGDKRVYTSYYPTYPPFN